MDKSSRKLAKQKQKVKAAQEAKNLEVPPRTVFKHPPGANVAQKSNPAEQTKQSAEAATPEVPSASEGNVPETIVIEEEADVSVGTASRTMPFVDKVSAKKTLAEPSRKRKKTRANKSPGGKKARGEGEEEQSDEEESEGNRIQPQGSGQSLDPSAAKSPRHDRSILHSRGVETWKQFNKLERNVDQAELANYTREELLGNAIKLQMKVICKLGYLFVILFLGPNFLFLFSGAPVSASIGEPFNGRE